MCLIMRCTPNSALVDRVDFATSQSLSSRSVTGLSALAPAQRAGAQRLCALALSVDSLQRRDMSGLGDEQTRYAKRRETGKE